MAFLPDGQRIGSLSSGCIENDIEIHAKASLKAGRPVQVRYGKNSPFMDIQLPCGGGLDILLWPRPDRTMLADLAAARRARQAVTLQVDMTNGAAGLIEAGETTTNDPLFQLRLEPDPFFYVFGKGPEASTFAALVQSAGYPNLLLSPDRETLRFAEIAGCETRHLTRPSLPADLHPDRWSAIVLFFHDHDWEPPILTAALDSPAFYIGAQGSQRARDTRLAELATRNLSPTALSRVRGPIGLVPSARDARTLAVSVLAEILSLA